MSSRLPERIRNVRWTVKNKKIMPFTFYHPFTIQTAPIKLGLYKESGVHLRYADENDFQCDSHSENKREVLKRIQHESHLRNVYIASNTQEAVVCYKDFLSGEGYKTFHLNGLLEGRKSAIKRLPEIKVPRSEINLVLDQNLLSMGNKVVLMNRSGYSFGSKFHTIIEIRHLMLQGH